MAAAELAAALAHLISSGLARGLRPKILGSDPSHPVLVAHETPPTVLGEQPHAQLTGRSPAVYPDRRLNLADNAASVPLLDGLLRLLRSGRVGHDLAGDRVPHHPTTMLEGDAVSHTILEHAFYWGGPRLDRTVIRCRLSLGEAPQALCHRNQPAVPR
jgi:hypothetical protein